MMSISDSWLAVRISALAEIRAQCAGPMLFINGIIGPATYLGLGKGIATRPGLDAHLLWGALVMSIWGATVWAAGGVLRRERSQGTLLRLVSSYTNPYLILWAKSLGAAVVTSVLATSATLALAPALHMKVDLGNLGVVFAAIVLLIFSSSALGTLLASLLIVTRHGVEWSSFLMFPVFTLGGLLVPAAMLPGVLALVPNLLSLHFVHKMLLANSHHAPIDVGTLGMIVALTCGYLVIGYVLFHRCIQRAKKTATLELG